MKLEIVKLVKSGHSKISVGAKFVINESTGENGELTGVEKKGLPISEIKKLLEYGLQIRQILEKDTLSNNEGKIAAILRLYPPMRKCTRLT